MRPAFEQIDEAAGKASRRIGAGIDRNEIAHGACERRSAPPQKRPMQPSKRKRKARAKS